MSGGAIGKENPWETFSGERELLISVVGHTFGPEPEKRFDAIVADRANHARRIRDWIGFSPSDIVIDLGSGVGLIAPTVAGWVRKVICMDISRPHIEYTRERMAKLGLGNVECVHMPFADFTAVKDLGVTKLYATAVFIHFNIFDIVCYLERIHEILARGGKCQIDILDYDNLDVYDDELFQAQIKAYKSSYSSNYLLTWHSLKAIRKIAGKIGFATEVKWVADSGNSFVVFTKI